MIKTSHNSLLPPEVLNHISQESLHSHLWARGILTTIHESLSAVREWMVKERVPLGRAEWMLSPISLHSLCLPNRVLLKDAESKCSTEKSLVNKSCKQGLSWEHS